MAITIIIPILIGILAIIKIIVIIYLNNINKHLHNIEDLYIDVNMDKIMRDEEE